MNCGCMRWSNNVCIVDEECIGPMHEERRHYFSKDHPHLAVPADSMFNFNIFDVWPGDMVVFDCGCTMLLSVEVRPFCRLKGSRTEGRRRRGDSNPRRSKALPGSSRVPSTTRPRRPALGSPERTSVLSGEFVLEKH